MTLPATHCPGPIDRRDFIRGGLLSLTGLGLGDLLRARAESAAAGQPAEDTACIVVWLHGGPSHLETYDMKPDAPEEYRGLFKPIHTRVPGMDVCELLPCHARVADRFSLIRSVSHGFFGHQDGVQQVLTGRPPRLRDNNETEFPDLGSIFKRARPQPREGLPHYVAIPKRFEYGGPAYLGKRYEPFPLTGNANSPNYQVPNLSLPSAAVSRFQERRQLLKHFDSLRRDLDAGGTMDAMDSYDREAVSLLTGDEARQAFDISRVDPKERDRYGRTQAGQSLFLARRLVEAGVGFVSVTLSDFQDVKATYNWDDHAVNWHIFEQMKLRLPAYDLAVTRLIEDLYERGLDQRVLVLVLGEFGRTPKINVVNGVPGREHYPLAMSILVSGGGLRMGQVVGSTEAKGERPRTRPLQITDFLATVYHHLGIDPRTEFPDFSGRPLPILPDGEPIRELVG